MNDGEYEQQKERLRALAERWIKPLGLGWWQIDLIYARDDYELPAGSSSDRAHSLAHCSCDWRYADASITWNMPLVKEQSDEELQRYFVHELGHIFVSEMRWARDNDHDGLDHEERVVTTLAKAFLWLREIAADEAKATAIHTEDKEC